MVYSACDGETINAIKANERRAREIVGWWWFYDERKSDDNSNIIIHRSDYEENGDIMTE